MYDELLFVFGEYWDLFCGWVVILVDFLDIFWIVGLKEEFDEVVKVVVDIDFMWILWCDIFVFEMMIWYFGGLFVVYDVSGGLKGDYGIFLEKVIELVEIFFGVFDMLNWMFDLYYKW